ncbi:MAG TPA: bacterioferritin [Terriglobales bacterium]|jgi:bacterioferritin|nr:bacterioferritin [Terriglobales bacterium]
MKGSAKVIKELNAALSSELSAIVQYMVQSEMHNNWGYEGLGAVTKKRAIEEMRHAEGLIERIIFLDATPEVEVGLKPRIGKDVRAHLETDLADELDAIKQYNAAVALCVKEGDNGTRELFEGMIEDEERHSLYLESQLQAIRDTGIENYLATQMEAKGEGK